MSRTAALGRAVLAFALGALLAAGSATAAPTISVRVSVKIIHDPATGQRPSIQDSPYLALQDSEIQGMIQWANDSLLSQYGRGYRFTLTEIVDVGTTCSFCTLSNPSYWYGTAFDNTTMSNFETWAKANPASYQWRSNAVNIYFNWGHGNGAVASFPPKELVVSGSRVFAPGFRNGFAAVIIHHELGHFFNLAHPNAKLDTCCIPDSCIRDGDGLEETLPDAPCFTLDQLSSYRWGLPFSAVDPVRQDSLWNTFWNNMIYLHPGQAYGQDFNKLLVESQLDQWTDTANSVRAPVVTGTTRFVVATGCGICPPASGTSTDPFVGIGDALGAAVPGDILLLRAGQYPTAGTISQAVTLRATRRGAARLIH